MPIANSLSLDQQEPSSPSTKISLSEERVATVCRFRPPFRNPQLKWNPEAFQTDLEKYTAVLPPSATNTDLFATIGKPLVEELLQGKNACVLAYGQTFSGKTHALVGNKTDRGLLPRCVQYLFDKCNANKRSMRFRVSVSIVEVYQEQIRDLIATADTIKMNNNNNNGAAAVASSSISSSSSPTLPPSSFSNLQLREKNEVFFLPEVNIKVCSTADAVLREVDIAFANRTTGNSYISDVSSRAHAIATISLAAETNVSRGSAPVLLLSRMSFVDLCGSEVLSDKFGSEQQSETKSINKSLFCLRGVVSALAEKASFIPYRDSVLTKILKATLSPDSMNAIVCTCSMEPEDMTLTQNTIYFGQTAQKIEQHITKRIFTREKGSGKIKMKDEADETVIKVEDVLANNNNKNAAANDKPPKVISTPFTFNTRQGDIKGRFFAREGVTPQQVIGNSNTSVGIALHAFGGGCRGQDMLDFAAPTINDGTVIGVFAPDFPGFGETNGNRQTSRTESLWQQGGPMEIVVDLLDYVTESKRTRQVLFIGWDWGANMALSLAVSPFKQRMSGLVLFHPSWTAPHEQLAPVKAPVLMLWNPNDTLHLIAHGRKMAKIMAKSKLVAVKPPAGQRGRESYDTLFDIMAIQIQIFVKSILGAVPKKTAAVAKNVVEEEQEKIKQQLQLQQKQKQQLPSSSSSSSSSSDDEDENNGNDDDDDNGGFERQDSMESMDDMSDFSRASSFLGILLADPEVVDAVVADERARQMRKDAKTVKVAVNSDSSSLELFGVLASLKNNSSVSNPHSQIVLAVVKAIHDICALNQKSRLALAYCLLGRDNALKSKIIGSLSLCPPLLPYARADAFLSLGYFSQVPVGAHAMSWSASRMFRYLPGRTVVVGMPPELVNQNMRDPARIGCLLSSSSSSGGVAVASAADLQRKFDSFVAAKRGNSGTFWSFRCRVVYPVSTSHVLVEIPLESAPQDQWMQFTVSISQLDKMNAPTNYPLGPTKASLVFEDAIRGRYDNLMLRTKLAQCCQAISSIVPKMDFDGAWQERLMSSSSSDSTAAQKNNELLKLQMKCVEEIRKCVDVHHHVARGKDPNRALVPDIGALATHGQFHCHGVSSAVAGVLLPFCALLGIDVRQRDGFFAGCGRASSAENWDGRPQLNSADHTWLEVSFYPSGANFVTDPSFSPGFGEDIIVTYRDAYCSNGNRYPTRDLVSAGSSRVLMDARQCFLLHEETNIPNKTAEISQLKQLKEMRKLVWNDSNWVLSFM